MKTLLEIKVDENGIGASELDINSEEENRQLALCMLVLMSKSKGFRNMVKAVVHCYNERTAEVKEAVEKTTLPPSALYSNNKQNSSIMEIEKLPSVIDGMQRDIALLKKRMDSIKGVSPAKKVRLVLKDGSLYEASDLDCLLFDLAEVDGIIVPVLDGREFLLYPKYAKRSMRKSSGTGGWKAKNMTEIESLYARTDGSRETDELLALDSPAAEFVRGVAAHRKFNLPGDLLAAMTVVLRCDEINAMAEHIDGADNLVKDIGVWSCSRHSDSNGWYASDYNGYGAYSAQLTCLCLAVPVVLYNR